jgi:hypothetical protein
MLGLLPLCTASFCSPEDQGVVHHHRQLNVPKVAGAFRVAQPTRGAPAAQRRAQHSTLSTQIGVLYITLAVCQQQGHLLELNVW